MSVSGDIDNGRRIATEADVQAAKTFVSELIAGLPDGESFNAQAVLSRHSFLRPFKSVVLDLAYEEYCRAEDLGRKIDPESFARRFSHCRYSLVRLLDAHEAIHGGGGLLEHATAAWPKVGDAFLGFHLVEQLGEGGFSRVFAALDPKANGRRVVLKVCLHGQYEVEAVAELNHDNIVPLYSVDQDLQTGLTGICMPFLGRTTLLDVLDFAFGDTSKPPSGETVGEAVESTSLLPRTNAQEAPRRASGQLPPRALEMFKQQTYVQVVVDIGLQLAGALQYTHARGICHGDLKPSNVLLTDEGRAMLFDFNLAHFSDRKSRVGGTLPYMSPEQLRASLSSGDCNAKLDARSDIFSLGAMLYQLLSGELPFGSFSNHKVDRETLVDELLARQKSGLVSLSAKNPKVDARLAGVIERCLAYEPAARYPSVGALAEALRRAQSRDLRRWAELHRRQVLGWGIGSLAVCTALGGSLAAYVVTRPPHGQWLTEQAMAAFQERDYKRTVSLLKQLPDDYQNDRTQLALARSYMHLGEFREAYDAFLKLDDILFDEPVYIACRGLCAAQMAAQRKIPAEAGNAGGVFRIAQRKGFNPPEIQNNIAYCLMKAGKRNEAQAMLDELDQAGVEVQSVYVNLATLDLIQLRGGIPNVRYVEKALAMPPDNAALHVLAATVYAHVAKRSPFDAEKKRYRAQVLAQMRLATDKGTSRIKFDGLTTTIPSLEDDPEFQQLRERAAERSTSSPAMGLADPLGGEDEPLMNLVPR